MNLKPFFTYYGGKWRAAPHYPTPKYKAIIEPFAGAAGYSLRYSNHSITLIEKDPVVAALWRYLISVSESEIRSLPLLTDGSVDDLDVCQEAKYLIGFWLNKGTTAPCKVPSRWMRDGIRPNSFWGEVIRERVASQVQHIRHWKVIETSYQYALNNEATWFIDPPYQGQGKYYKCSSNAIDFSALGQWCRGLEGQVIVCEQDGASWLPFKPFMTIKASPSSRGKGSCKEVIWTND